MPFHNLLTIKLIRRHRHAHPNAFKLLSGSFCGDWKICGSYATSKSGNHANFQAELANKLFTTFYANVFITLSGYMQTHKHCMSKRLQPRDAKLVFSREISLHINASKYID